MRTFARPKKICRYKRLYGQEKVTNFVVLKFTLFYLLPETVMGKGDRRTRKGKIFARSYGKTRQKKKKNTYVPTKEKAVTA